MFTLPSKLSTSETQPASASVMVDSGCSPYGFIDKTYSTQRNFTRHKLPRPRILRLADGTEAGTVTEYCLLDHDLEGFHERLSLYVWPLDGPDAILGLPWLRHHNPTIDWTSGSLTIHGHTIHATEHTGPNPVPAPTPHEPDLAPTTDIALLNAASFLFSAKGKGTEVFKTSFAALHAITSTTPNTLLDRPDLESADDIVLATASTTLRSILSSEEPTEPIGPRLRAFQSWIKEAPWLRAIKEEDIEKYLQSKPPATDEEIRAQLPPEYHDLIQAFQPSEAETLPPHRPFDHRIEIMAGKTPPNYRARPMSVPELRVIRKYLDEHLNKGFIRPSTSSAAAPVLLARKPGGGIRICVDYRGLNNVTVKNRYPIPLIRETLDMLSRAKYYTKLDITAAFNRLRIAPGDEWKTAFITRFGLYECLVANFGMTGAPSSFQHYINHTLFDILDKFVTAYLDDILIFSKTRAEHRRHVREVIQRLIKAGLTIDIRKCEFGVQETKYLGLIISTSGIKMDPEKVSAITSWKPPETLKDLQRFVGFANFYRRFIKNFSRIAQPLTSLMSNEKWPGALPDEALQAFHELKTAFVSAPVLNYFDPERRTVVEVDASDWASGGVLSQYDETGELHPVAFFSAKHTPAECNYEIYDKELMAIVKAFEEWRPELQGLRDAAEVVTDHKNLEHFTTTKLLNQRQVRWSEFLSDFRFQITYRPGKKATIPDALTRMPGDAPRTSDTTDDRIANRLRTLLPPSLWQPGTGPTPPLRLLTLDTSRHIDEHIDAAYESSDIAKRIRAAIEDPNCRKFPRLVRQEFKAAMADCRVVQGKVYYRDRLYIPPVDDVRLQVLHRSHTAAPAGHPGRFKTYDILRRSYFWPRMSRDTATFVMGCNLCARTKSSRTNPLGFLDPLPIPFRPWTDISVDYIGPLPPCKYKGLEFTHVLVVVDRLTKMRHFIPVPDTTAEGLADAFVSDVYRLHGAPQFIVSDRGTQFVSAFWKELSRRMGTTLKASTAFHPQTDGQTEIFNAGLEQYLRSFCSFYQDDWASWLPLAEFAANNQTSETTGLSPFFANYGWHPVIGTEPTHDPTTAKTPQQQREFLNATNVANRIQRVHERARAFMAEAQERHADYADRHRSDAGTFQVGDLVWVNTKNLKTRRPSEKLDDKWQGPYNIISAYPRAVTLDLPKESRLFPTFHTSLIKHYQTGLQGQEAINEAHDRRAAGVTAATSPRNENETEDKDEWYFNRILSSRNTTRGLEYKVEWPLHRPTWEPAENLRGCDSDIQDFHDQNPTKPGPPAWFTSNTAQAQPNNTEQPRRRGRPRKRKTHTNPTTPADH